mgnify:CR=1 FL=1|jgi:hypothetical protein
MNPLVALKEKLMIKPNIEERGRVAVIIKGVKKERKPKAPKIKSAKVDEELEEELQEDEEKIDKIILEQTESDEDEKQDGPLIVDETEKGYDREALIKKLIESKKMKVTVKPSVQISEKKISEYLPLHKPTEGKKVKKIQAKNTLVIEEDDDEEQVDLEPNEEKIMEKPKKKVAFEEESPEEFIMKPKKKEEEVIPIVAPKKKKRLTEKPEKGIAILGPETLVNIGDTDLTKRLPKKSPPVIIKVSSYYMNNREIFINFINSLFEPYRQEIQENKESISCDTIGQTSSDFSLLTHQKIVRDYLNLYTPYRGLLLYHGLGSGKTCTSIAIAEGMKDSKRVIIMTPASLRANYIEELKKCGDLLYKRNQYWEWVSTVENQDALKTISVLLNLPQEYIRRHGGAFFINVKKPTNYNELSDIDKKVLEEQLNEMIRQKYTFINYNGLRSTRLAEMTSNYTRNIFDNSVVIIDEAHNLISRIVNKIKKEKDITGEERKKKKEAKTGEPVEEKEEEESIFGEQTPLNLASKLYYMLLRAKNARVVLLSGTPVINYPNEFAILFNILRGYIKTWKIPLNVKTSKKIDKQTLQEILMGEKSLDYLDYSPSSKILTVTRNPFGFKNKIKKESGYQGVSNVKKGESGDLVIDNEFTSDDDFERKIISILKRNNIDIIPQGVQVINQKALPDSLNTFMTRYINENDKSLQNVDALKRRIIGLSSYFRSAQESLLPRYNKQLGVDYHIVRIPMSDTQFKIYEAARKQERDLEKKQKPKSGSAELFEEKASTYRIFSRLFCNYVMPDRPIPMSNKKKKNADKDEEKTNPDEPVAENIHEMAQLIKEGTRIELKQDVSDEREGEIEGDEILGAIGGVSYKERLDRAIKNIEEHSNDFLTPEALQTYSPKFLHMLENIDDPEHQGLHLVYSQFRTAEGIGLFSLVLEKNGFTRFKIKKNHHNIWEIDIPDVDEGKPTYALYTGTETSEEKEMLRHIYNGEWNQIPESIGSVLKSKYRNNNMGEVIKVFMITSSGSEGINLRNTRYVHIMEPYWHPVRSEQVIGRARRICSHKDLPKALQTVEVYVYLMIFSESQINSDEAIELKRKDLSKALPRLPITSDQYLFEISEIKANLTAQLTDAVKETSFDCYIYSNGKCVNFGDPTNEKYAYVPDYAEQQNDTTVRANKVAIEWVGKPITINGVEYVYRRNSKNILDLYDMETYKKALEDSSIQPLKVGTYEINENGEKVLKLIV